MSKDFQASATNGERVPDECCYGGAIDASCLSGGICYKLYEARHTMKERTPSAASESAHTAFEKALLAVEAEQAKYQAETWMAGAVRGALENAMNAIRALKNAAPQEQDPGTRGTHRTEGDRPAVAAPSSVQSAELGKTPRVDAVAPVDAFVTDSDHWAVSKTDYDCLLDVAVQVERELGYARGALVEQAQEIAELRGRLRSSGGVAPDVPTGKRAYREYILRARKDWDMNTREVAIAHDAWIAAHLAMKASSAAPAAGVALADEIDAALGDATILRLFRQHRAEIVAALRGRGVSATGRTVLVAGEPRSLCDCADDAPCRLGGQRTGGPAQPSRCLLGAPEYPDTEADGVVFCGKCGHSR